MRAAIPLSALFAAVLGFGAAAVKKDVAAGAAPASGSELFAARCASCHGQNGKGQGARAAALKTAPPDLTTLALRNNGSFPFVRVSGTISGDLPRAEYVSREMPCFGLIFRAAPEPDRETAQARVAALTEYVRSLQAK